MAGGMVQVPFGNAMINRIAPVLPAHSFKTYGVAMPLRSHWRPASCEEVDCPNYLNGWVTTVDLGTDLGQKQADYIRHDRTRRHTEQHVSLTLVKFVFGPGMRCFRSADHRALIGRPPRYFVKGGDWRGNPRGEHRMHANGRDWAEDFAGHQDRLLTALGRG